MRRSLVLTASAYLAFVIYGSLVPLEFRAVPWGEAVARFREVPYLSLGIGSRADWVANLLLFIPLGFLWTGAVVFGRTKVAVLLGSLLVVALAVLLSVAIEFTQLFFPPRTVSRNDIAAEALGGVIGALAWGIAGDRLTHWYEGWRQARGRASVAERLAWLYLAGLLFYNLLPVDLTISAVEIFHKWQEGKVRLVPFAGFSGDTAQVLYELVTDALIWTPLAFLWRLGADRSAWRAWGMTVAAATLVEALQLFVYSRLTDVTDLVTATLGATAGVLLAGRLVEASSSPDSASERSAARTIWLRLALAGGWVAILFTAFWYPFDFRADTTFVRGRLDFLGRVPFEIYYFGTEYRAATEFLHKTLWFAPLGALLAWTVDGLPVRWRKAAGALAAVAAVLVALGVELGQVLLPGRIPDTTDWALESVGAIAGYLLARHLLRVAGRNRLDTTASDPPAAPAPALPQSAWPANLSRWHGPLVVAALTLGIWGIASSPLAPYNVRELLDPKFPPLSAALLALCSYLLAVLPVRLARGYTVSAHTLWLLPCGLMIYGGVAYLLLRLAVPTESIHDIVGSPVLGWGWEWESLLRFMGLAAIPGALLYLAAQSARQVRGLRLGAWHWVAALLVLTIAHWVVVTQAATDNLVELLARHPLAFASFCAFLFTLFLTAALLASPALRGRPGLTLMILLLSLALAALSLAGSLAAEIDKYGERFSALQFLLSRDRQSYAGTGELWARYTFLHLVVIGGLVVMQWPHFRTRRLQGNHRPQRPYFPQDRLATTLAAKALFDDRSSRSNSARPTPYPAPHPLFTSASDSGIRQSRGTE
jgi:glycopeptide antibiotics resistance protein